MSASQAGGRRFDPGLPLLESRVLAAPSPAFPLISESDNLSRGTLACGWFTGGVDAWNDRIGVSAPVIPYVVPFRRAAPQVRAVFAGSNRPGALRR